MIFSRDRVIRLLISVLLYVVIGTIFFFIPPYSRFIIWSFIALIGCATGFFLWTFIPLRFASYVAFFVAYLLFLLAEHVVQVDLVAYMIIIIVFTELFIGRRFL